MDFARKIIFYIMRAFYAVFIFVLILRGENDYLL